jgi:nucleotide-binding universal stress UspA family protein
VQKLTSILAVLDSAATSAMVLRKATDLAGRFNARITVLAIEPLVSSRIVPQCAELGYPDIAIRAVSRLGKRLQKVILEEVRARNPDLVVKARTGAHAVRRFSLAPNDWWLSQECPVPLMLVGPRPWVKPPRLAAAVDVSGDETLAVARAVMQTAGFLALGTHGELDVLYTEREQNDDRLRMARAVQLAQLVREFHVGCERLQMFDGVPEKRLPPLIASRQYDVLILGATTYRTGLSETMRPLTGQLVDAAPGDVVLVRTEERENQSASRAGSAGKQIAHQGQQLV